jgi:hypothetical protein
VPIGLFVERDMRVKFLLMSIFGFLLILGLATSAMAQGKKRRVIRLEEAVIKGRVAKPSAFFISTASVFAYEFVSFDESFLDEITKVVDEGPF